MPFKTVTDQALQTAHDLFSPPYNAVIDTHRSKAQKPIHKLVILLVLNKILVNYNHQVK